MSAEFEKLKETLREVTVPASGLAETIAGIATRRRRSIDWTKMIHEKYQDQEKLANLLQNMRRKNEQREISADAALIIEYAAEAVRILGRKHPELSIEHIQSMDSDPDVQSVLQEGHILAVDTEKALAVVKEQFFKLIRDEAVRKSGFAKEYDSIIDSDEPSPKVGETDELNERLIFLSKAKDEFAAHIRDVLLLPPEEKR